MKIFYLTIFLFSIILVNSEVVKIESENSDKATNTMSKYLHKKCR